MVGDVILLESEGWQLKPHLVLSRYQWHSGPRLDLKFGHFGLVKLSTQHWLKKDH